VWRLYPRTVVHRPRASTPVVQVGAQCCTAIDGVSPDQDASTDHDSPHIPPHPFCAPDPLVVFRTLRRRFEAPGYLCQPACCIAIAAGIEGRVHSVSIQWAEYAETEQIIQRLRELGVEYAQGYGIEKPRAVARVFAALQARPSQQHLEVSANLVPVRRRLHALEQECAFAVGSPTIPPSIHAYPNLLHSKTCCIARPCGGSKRTRQC
jgi:hypothetical protein